jgi:hypothetical protein
MFLDLSRSIRQRRTGVYAAQLAHWAGTAEPDTVQVLLRQVLDPVTDSGESDGSGSQCTPRSSAGPLLGYRTPRGSRGSGSIAQAFQERRRSRSVRSEPVIRRWPQCRSGKAMEEDGICECGLLWSCRFFATPRFRTSHTRSRPLPAHTSQAVTAGQKPLDLLRKRLCLAGVAALGGERWTRHLRFSEAFS